VQIFTPSFLGRDASSFSVLHLALGHSQASYHGKPLHLGFSFT
jgi:hypothetical protein